MANYRNIHGINIETVTSNPNNPANGQVWYNSTDQKLRGNAQTTAGAWATSNDINTTRGRLAGDGTQDSAVIFGGHHPGSKNETEVYNGTSWTEVNNLNLARSQHGAAGSSSTAAIGFAGTAAPPFNAIKDETESWNGTSWTEVNDLNTARRIVAGCGIETSALCVGGYTTETIANNESWNGTSWTEVADLNQTKYFSGSGAGVSNTSALVFGGHSPFLNSTESWNGSSWTELNNLNQGKYGIGGSGTQTAALAAGGAIPPDANTANTELWNGTSWAEQNNLNTATSQMASGGTTSAGFVAGGGYSPPVIAKTEEWNGAGANSTREFDLS